MVRGELPGSEAIEEHLLSIDRDQFSRSRPPWSGTIMWTTPERSAPNPSETALSDWADLISHAPALSSPRTREAEFHHTGRHFWGPLHKISDVWGAGTALSGAEAALAADWTAHLCREIAPALEGALGVLGARWREHALYTGRVPEGARPQPRHVYLQITLQIWRGLGSLDIQHCSPGCGATVWNAELSDHTPLLVTEYANWHAAARQSPGSPAGQNLRRLEAIGYAQSLWPDLAVLLPPLSH